MMLAMSNQHHVGKKVDSFSFFDGDFVFNSKFEDCNFDDINLTKVTFNECVFQDCTFNNAALHDIFFNDCQLTSCSFIDVNIIDTVFDTSCLDNCEFTDATALYDVEFTQGAIRRCLFKHNCSGNDTIDFNNILIMSSIFQGFDFTNCEINKTNIRGARFIGCDITKAHIKKSEVAWCIFRHSKFRDMIIEDTPFIKSKFRNCGFERTVKIRGDVIFTDTFLYKTSIPAEVNVYIQVAHTIRNDDMAEPPPPPDNPALSPCSSLARNFIDSQYDDDGYPSQSVCGFFHANHRNQLALPGAGMTSYGHNNVYNYSARPAKHAKRAYRFFTDGV